VQALRHRRRENGCNGRDARGNSGSTVELSPGESPADLIAGRIALIVNEL